jgi:hypothetical protein
MRLRAARMPVITPHARGGQRSSLRANPRRKVGGWLRAQSPGLPLQRIDLGVQRGYALTLPHTSR